MLGGDNPEPSNAIGRLRIESEGSDDDGFHDDVDVDNLEPPSDSDDGEIQITEKSLEYYGTDLKEWNHYDKPKNSICNFKNFLSTLYYLFIYTLFFVDVITVKNKIKLVPCILH